MYKNVKYIRDVCSIQHTYLIENSLMCMMLFPVTIAQIIHMQGIKGCVIMVHLLPSKEIIVQDVSLNKIMMSVCLYAHVNTCMYHDQYMFNKYLIYTVLLYYGYKLSLASIVLDQIKHRLMCTCT